MNSNKVTYLIIWFLLMALSGNSQDYTFPVIENYGGVVDLEKAILPDKGGKILIDLTKADTIADGVSKSMDRVARLINLYALAGIPPEEVEVAVIIHGPATERVLSDKEYREKFGKDNPDLPVIKVLKEEGVNFMVCGQALAIRGFNVSQLHPDVKLALSAITVLVDYQQKGYQVLYF